MFLLRNIFNVFINEYMILLRNKHLKLIFINWMFVKIYSKVYIINIYQGIFIKVNSEYLSRHIINVYQGITNDFF